ncbi:hypothetical protein TPADAL_0152a [Treponema pallidum subsp. pallidum DAL-1]|uniref:Uncharacterized protein n=2 Tax=Treponema pallidum TaxID=160 RepID=A0AAU8RW15_TREPL|nr:hypothetical protein TPESAMD_0152a [Treponema pallidum subsp. pertenue str. SamoaD]AEZ58347.1 hypothetical protein TPECDC2_0152a [Treponema pallidum subsp. pertenue str. CDC2]AEZ59415.1 hypothetical protein TPEGAU_0152a [Treponema pallidum subsp. pertenue str. Gauthier]AEZ60479.1 hypothetical protein TPADAL_0152a [Treponema pallidum subsp. pallidum DAL-1]AJB40178.1 hypothetical protein TENDBA_0152a [Treponema pallidum subsp. endemicum str. Bosnia A]ASV57808.1 hypothetical protein TPEGhana05
MSLRWTCMQCGGPLHTEEEAVLCAFSRVSLPRREAQTFSVPYRGHTNDRAPTEQSRETHPHPPDFPPQLWGECFFACARARSVLR